MTAALPIDRDYLISILEELWKIPSPTGRADPAIDRVAAEFTTMGIDVRQTAKGGLVATLQGLGDDTPRGLTAHVDTLGAMVKEIKSSGRLKLTKIGGFAWNTGEGEGCTGFPRQGGTMGG